jgi:molybdenum cofactor cytidylyltransferase
MSSISNIGVVILAAGSSSRMGIPKQLLEFDGITLLSHAVIEAVNSNTNIVVVVIGTGADLIVKEIDKYKVHVVENKNWEEGMASSVRLGLNTLLQNKPEIDAVIIMVCDQPFVSSVVLNDLITTHMNSGKPITVCNYGEAIGPPTLFHRSLFNELMELKGDVGAKKIIQQHSNEVATVLFPKGSIDIDTMEDYESIIKS